MRTVAISTVEKGYLLANYGSFFQHYALREVLKRLGYVPFRVLDGGELRSNVTKATDWIKDGLRPLYWLMTKYPNRKLDVARLRMQRRLNRIFKRDYERLIGRFKEPQLFNNSTVGIRGGDQVLVPDSDRRWLVAVKNGNPRITYAVSTDWKLKGESDAWKHEMSCRLKEMTAVGIREKKGVSIVRTLVPQNISVQHVADPVVLLGAKEFQKIQLDSPVFQKPTLLCYLLNIRSRDDLVLEKFELLATALKCELKIVGIQGAELYVPKDKLLTLSPVQFLRALDDAEYFATNSYHGSVFALLYHKQFVSIRQNCLPGMNQNERQQELMTGLGLDDYWLDLTAGNSNVLSQISNPIDWMRTDALLRSFREESLNWLKESLSA